MKWLGTWWVTAASTSSIWLYCWSESHPFAFWKAFVCILVAEIVAFIAAILWAAIVWIVSKYGDA